MDSDLRSQRNISKPPEYTRNPDGSSATPTTARGYTRFEWDATTTTAANGPAALGYTLTPQDSTGTALNEQWGHPLADSVNRYM